MWLQIHLFHIFFFIRFIIFMLLTSVLLLESALFYLFNPRKSDGRLRTEYFPSSDNVSLQNTLLVCPLTLTNKSIPLGCDPLYSSFPSSLSLSPFRVHLFLEHAFALFLGLRFMDLRVGGEHG